MPGVAVGALLLRRALALTGSPAGRRRRRHGDDASFGLQQFSVAFLNEYWLHFELDVGAAGGRGRGGAGRHQGRKQPWISSRSCSLLSLALFALGLLGVIVRRNLLVMLMCMELMLNGVNLSLVTFAQQTGTAAGAVLVFLIFVVAAAEIAIAIPIVLLLVRRKRTLDADAYADLKG